MIAQNTRILWLPGADERHWDYESGSFGGSSRNPAGVRIDPESALRSTVVLACVRVLASSVAGLPLHLYRRLPNGGKELARENPLYRVLHDRPNGWQTSYEWREQMMLHLLTHGQAFVEISGAGPQTQLIVLHPSRMKVDRIESGRLRYTYREASGSSTVYAQDAIMHLRWLSDDGVNGLVPVEIASDAIGLARACEIHGASFFANGARPGIVLSTDQMLSPEAAENTRNQWERAHRGPDRAHRTAVLQGGLKVNEFGGNNQEAQFLEARRFQVEEICRIYGVPPHLVGDLSRSSYSNIEQQSLDYLQNGLMPWLRRIESAISRDLIADDELFAEFDTRGALRADAAGRAAFYAQMANLGVLSVNDIRSAENMNPVEGGDERFVQLNMTTLTKAAAQPEAAQPAAPVEKPQPEPTTEVTGLLAILQAVSAGVLDKSGAAAAVAAAFPAMPADQIDAILDGVAAKKPQEPTPPQASPPPAKRDCGTGAGGFKPGNKCAGDAGGGSGDSSGDAGRQWLDKLPKDQQKAVDGWIDRDFEVIRDIQSIQGRPGYDPSQLSQEAIAKTEAWEKAINAAPKYDGVAYRGINPHTNTKGFRPEDYQVGDVIEFTADSSATTDRDIGKKFSMSPTVVDVEDVGTEFKPKPGVVLEIHAEGAADISGVNTAEKEVIIRRGQSYRVERIEGYQVTLRRVRQK